MKSLVCISLSYKHWQYPLLLSILTFFQIYVGYLVAMDWVILSILNPLSQILFIFVEFISCYLSRKHTAISTSERLVFTSAPVSLYKPKRQINWKVIISMLLLASFSFFPNLMLRGYLSNQMLFLSNLQAFFGLLLASLLSMFFIRWKILKHQLLGLAIILFDLIIYFWVLFKERRNIVLQTLESFDVFFIVFAFNFIPIAIRDSIEKYLMQIHFISPFLLLFTEGIFSLTMLIALSFIPDTFCDRFKSNFFFFHCFTSRWEYIQFLTTEFFTGQLADFDYALAFCILCIIVNMLRIQTSRVLSPTHKYIAELLFSFYYLIFAYWANVFGRKTNMSLKSKYVEIIQLPIVLFASFVYNEYVIIHKWKLDEDTTDNIVARSREETDTITKYFQGGCSLIKEEDEEYEQDSHPTNPDEKKTIT